MNSKTEERMKLIGKRIKEMREAAGLTQPQLAAALNNGLKTDRGKSTISEYEHGKHIRIDKVFEIADVLECDPNYLLGCQLHPDVTTSWIAEQIPLRRDAIESLEAMKYRLDEWSDSESLLMGYNILSDIIVHIEESLHGDIIDESGKLIEKDDFISNVIDLLFAYESIADNEKFKGTPLQIDRSYRNELLAIRGVSSWLGSDIAEVIRRSVKSYADPGKAISEEV